LFQIGDKIGSYTLIDKLGRGAFGVVWLAEKRTRYTSTRFALKLPLHEDVDVEAIKQEAGVWERGSGHPNVLPLIEADDHDGQIVIVSEYAPDGTLATYLSCQDGKINPNAAIDMTLGILAGLEHLHQRRIIHRDVKPDNILLQGSTPRLADFGIARVLKTTNQTSSASGTPIYMAPEAFDGKRSEKTDLWAVGVILYQLLAGHVPFGQLDMPSLLAAIIQGDPEPLPSSVPTSVARVVFRSLEKNPSLRYSSAAEMRAALLDAAQTMASEAQAETIRISHENLPSAAPTASPLPTERDTVSEQATALSDTRPRRTNLWITLLSLMMVAVAGTIGGYLYLNRSTANAIVQEDRGLLKTLIEIDTQYKDATRKGDRTALDALLSDELRVTMNGKWMGDKKTLLIEAEKSKGMSFPMPEDPRMVSQTATTAVIAYELGETRQVNANFYSTRSRAQTEFTRENDRWRISRMDLRDIN